MTPDGADEEPDDGEFEAIVGTVPMLCQYNYVAPCLAKSPQPAAWVVHTAECNCDEEPEDRVVAYCEACFRDLWTAMNQALGIQCKCGVVFKPARSAFADVVRVAHE